MAVRSILLMIVHSSAHLLMAEFEGRGRPRAGEKKVDLTADEIEQLGI
jgi:hypothetical protein